ncbi:hypothetical protein F0919_17860 [Taibaiella lutea]|uniref:Phage portal protein n=1 Tax=Taibaiella lutea TaxID=2608001 RepID=A0A5M6CBZ2_9BACT|nr:hypothetical protein [Taibaiella lutea]KAA5532647.1 hypothetical protein F0919_17860 [Taibaiella lutea]
MPPGAKKRIVSGKKTSIHVSNEVVLDAKNPIPFEFTGASYNVDSGNAYIPFLFPNDNFFGTLLEARIQSPTQNACITTKTDYTIGDGLSIKDVDPEKWPAGFLEIFQKANRKKETLNTVLKKAIENFYTTGNAPIEILRGTVAGKKFVYVYSHNFLDCRLGVPDASGDIVNMIYSRQFRKKGVVTDAEKFKSIPLYDRGFNKNKSWSKDTKTGVERTAIWLQNAFAGYDDYGMPSSVPSILHQCLEYQGARYNLDNLENNMVVGGAIVLAGNVSQAEADKLGRKILNQHTGSGKRGRVAVFASEAGIEQSKFMPFDTRKEGSFKEQNAEARDVIILSNQWDAVLAGLQSESALGKGAGYLQEIYEQKLNTVINPIVNFFIENLIKPIAEIAQDWLGEKWSDPVFTITPKALKSKGNRDLMNSADGIRITLEIIKAIAEGWYSVEAAVELLINRLGCTREQAIAEIGTVSKIPYVPKKSNKP